MSLAGQGAGGTHRVPGAQPTPPPLTAPQLLLLPPSLLGFSCPLAFASLLWQYLSAPFSPGRSMQPSQAELLPVTALISKELRLKIPRFWFYKASRATLTSPSTASLGDREGFKAQSAIGTPGAGLSSGGVSATTPGSRGCSGTPLISAIWSFTVVPWGRVTFPGDSSQFECCCKQLTTLQSS